MVSGSAYQPNIRDSTLSPPSDHRRSLPILRILIALLRRQMCPGLSVLCCAVLCCAVLLEVLPSSMMCAFLTCSGLVFVDIIPSPISDVLPPAFSSLSDQSKACFLSHGSHSSASPYWLSPQPTCPGTAPCRINLALQLRTEQERGIISRPECKCRRLVLQ
jgi:hypothetical protein